MPRLARTAVLVLLTCAPPAWSAPVVFTDGTFADADWTVTTFATGPGSSVEGTQGADGNPPPGRQVRNVLGPASSPDAVSNVYAAHLSSAAVYDPSTQGPIATVDFLVEAMLLDGFGDGQAIGLALRQNGMVYIRQAGITPDRAWTRKESLAVSASGVVHLFGPATTDPMQLPDFSASGGPIEFGFYTANSTRGGSGYVILTAYDNWSIRVNTTCSSTADCVYPDACLVGECQAGACRATTVPCDDGDACTTDACVAGACAFTPVGCDDGVSCTQDACAAGACVHDVGFDSIDGAIDQLRAALSTSPCADDIPAKLRKKLDKKLKKAQAKLAGADAATKAQLIDKLVGRADSLLGLARTLLAGAQATGVVSPACATGLDSLLADAAGCVSALSPPAP
jgi:hypothetical protein